MKIAILGAPGSGKTKIAKRVATALKKDMLQPWKVIDGYVEELSKRTGLPFGATSTIPHNLTVITDRWVREAELRQTGANTITCGTLYESLIYSTFSTLFIHPNEDMNVYNQLHYRTLMEALGVLENRTFDYDAIFWLPWSQAHAEEDTHSWEAVVNAKIPEVLEGFGKYAIPLTGKDKQNVDRIVEVVRIAATWTQTPEDEQRSVRLGDQDGQGTEHQPEPMSNVPPEEVGDLSGDLGLEAFDV